MNPAPRSPAVAGSAPPGRSPDLRQTFAHLWRLARLARGFRRDLARSIALGLAVGAVGVAVPYLTKLLIDEVYPRRDVNLLAVLVALLFALSGGSALAGALRAYYAVHVKSRLGGALRLHFFNHLQHLPMRFFDTHQVGEVSSRFLGVTRGVDSLARGLESTFTQGVFLLLVPPVLLWMDPLLGLLALAVVPAVSVVTVLATRRLRRLWRTSSERSAELSAYEIEVLTRIRTFKGLALERRVFAGARRHIRRATVSHLHAARAGQAMNALSALLRAAGTALLTWVGWRLILAGRLSLGDLVAFTTYVAYLYTPLFMLVQLASNVQQSAVHVGRMFEYLDEAPEQDPARAAGPPPPPLALRGGYRLDGVRFAYAAGAPVLHGLDLAFEAGSFTAVVGASGCGKTTLLRLLAAFEHPDDGAVRLDGRPLAELPLASLRRRVSVAWQDAGLVRGSLWHNLTLGCEKAPPRRRVEEIVAACALDELVASLPEGFETAVAEAGASLSAGQQQRVALARALLRDTPVLLLDEALANVDAATERRVLAELLRRTAGRTVVYVTHRLETATLAPRLVVMEDGRLAGVGGHGELLAGCAAYRRLHGVEEAARQRDSRQAAASGRGPWEPPLAVSGEGA
jgi:ABC-type bacteriocin/lantibiotic exporter with double-glycine peptidase domain